MIAAVTWGLVVLDGMTIAAWMTLAAAQDPAGTVHASQAGELIIVTGERVGRSLRDTPTSVEVFTKNQIENTGADRVEQLLELVPNLQISSGGEGPTIRGQDTTGPTRDLPAFLGGTRPRTTLIVDGRPVTFNEFVFGIAPLWDVSRVEVFRSPQTTTQGQNSIAGAIFVETSDPAFESEYRARFSAGDYKTRQISVAGTAPLNDEVAVRVAGEFRYSRTASRMSDRAEGVDPNHDVYGLLRVKLLARPKTLAGSRFGLNFSHSQSQMPQIEGVRAPFDQRRDANATYGIFRTNVDSATAYGEVEMSPKLSLKTILTGGDSRSQRFAPAGLGEAKIHGQDWSVETILRWSPLAPLQATLGTSFRQADLKQRIDLSQLSGIGRFKDDQSAMGLFGEASWAPVPRLHLIVGLRYQRDRQTREGALETSGAPISLDYRRRFHAWLPKVSVAYDLTGSVRIGALILRGYNPGGTTLRFDTGAPDVFQAESLWDYELFARASFAEDKLVLSANLFHYDIHDAQRSQPISIVAPSGSTVTFADLFNVSRARSDGAELSLVWRPASPLSLRMGAGLLSTKIIEAGATYASFEGKEFQRSPSFTGSAALDWHPWPALTLSAQIHHNSGYFSEDLNLENREIEGWTTINARATWQHRHVVLFGYVRNLLDDFHLTHLLNPALATAGDPREFGLGLETRF